MQEPCVSLSSFAGSAFKSSALCLYTYSINTVLKALLDIRRETQHGGRSEAFKIAADTSGK